MLFKTILGREFAYNIDENGCHIPSKAPHRDGYVYADFYWNTLLLCRLVYDEKHGLRYGGYILHTCGNRACINVYHLWLGDDNDKAMDNFRRRSEKARKGIAHHKSKINEEMAKSIYLTPGKYSEIAEMFGISIDIVSKIKIGKTWSHVTKDLQKTDVNQP